jgi:hypothetical protein
MKNLLCVPQTEGVDAVRVGEVAYSDFLITVTRRDKLVLASQTLKIKIDRQK